VAHEVTYLGHDRTQLAPMALGVRDAIGSRKLRALADRGYFSGLQILECEQHGITPLVPKVLTSNNLAEGRFDKRDFQYLPNGVSRLRSIAASTIVPIQPKPVRRKMTPRQTVKLTG
jgi:hypothetical protein